MLYPPPSLLGNIRWRNNYFWEYLSACQMRCCWDSWIKPIRSSNLLLNFVFFLADWRQWWAPKWISKGLWRQASRNIWTAPKNSEFLPIEAVPLGCWWTPLHLLHVYALSWPGCGKLPASKVDHTQSPSKKKPEVPGKFRAVCTCLSCRLSSHLVSPGSSTIFFPK